MLIPKPYKSFARSPTLYPPTGRLAAYTTNWRDGQHIAFDDSGHFIPFDQFERFIEVLTAFLNTH